MMMTYSIKGQVELVTPEMATHYLSLSGGNRSIRAHRLAALCRDRIAGHWFVTHQGAVFDTDNVLRDGHHRLTMIIRTGLPTPLFVVRGMDPKAAQYIDGGLPRSYSDAMRMAGIGDYSSEMTSAAKFFIDAPADKSTPLSIRELRAVIEEYAEPLSFSCERLKAKKAGISRSVRALVARAWLHVPEDRLSEFCDVICTGKPANPEHDEAGIVYSRYLISSQRLAGRVLEIERYQKGQTCLDCFVKRQPMSRVYGTGKDMYPLPK